MKSIFGVFTFLFSMVASIGMAQDTVEMATGMRESGKIYVVVSVICLIFMGILTYLIMIDKRVTDLEKKIKNKSVSR